MSKVWTACLLGLGALALIAQPQSVVDSPGVTVGMNGSNVMHRLPVAYPAAAIQQGIQGTLSVEVTLDSTGNVADARILSGPEQLRKSTLQSVLQWHFTRDSAGLTRVISVTFQVPKQQQITGTVVSTSVNVQATAPPAAIRGGLVSGGVIGGIVGTVPTTRVVKSVAVLGLPEQAAGELLSKLPVHEGDTWSPELMMRVSEVARQYDEHLSVRTSSAGTIGEIAVQIVPPSGGGLAVGTAMPVPGAINVSGNVQAAMILKKVTPAYPELAKSARISGVVHLAAVIGKDGTIQELHNLEGPALLVQAAMDAVKQWVYKPTLINGEPVAVQTTIDVNFTLNE